MTAIETLVEFMDKFPNLHGTEYIRYAKALAKEEKAQWGKCPIFNNPCPMAQKPTADASLVEELDEWIKSNPFLPGSGFIPGFNVAQDDIKAILSRYHPAPTSEEGLREKIEKIANETISPPIPEVLFDVLIDRVMSAIPAPVNPCAELVRRIKGIVAKAKTIRIYQPDINEIDEILRDYEEGK